VIFVADFPFNFVVIYAITAAKMTYSDLKMYKVAFAYLLM